MHTFLSTAYGREIVLQQNYGKVIKELTEDQIGSVVVPLLEDEPTKKINSRALRAARHIDCGRIRFERADRILRDAFLRLGIPVDDREGDINSFPVRSGELGDRIDPHFHFPRAEKLRNCADALKGRYLLNSIADVSMPNRFARPALKSAHGVPFYSSADMMRARKIPGSLVSPIVGRQLTKCQVRVDTILVCRSGAFGGIMGRTSYASKIMGGWHVSEHMLRVNVKQNAPVPPEYVYGVLSMKCYGYPLITALRHGKDVPEIDPDELGTLIIPKISAAKMAEVVREIALGIKHFDVANYLEERNEEELSDLLKVPPEWRQSH